MQTTILLWCPQGSEFSPLLEAAGVQFTVLNCYEKKKLELETPHSISWEMLLSWDRVPWSELHCSSAATISVPGHASYWSRPWPRPSDLTSQPDLRPPSSPRACCGLASQLNLGGVTNLPCLPRSGVGGLAPCVWGSCPCQPCSHPQPLAHFPSGSRLPLLFPGDSFWAIFHSDFYVCWNSTWLLPCERQIHSKSSCFFYYCSWFKYLL